jgi:signal transduction histidine kinase
MHRAFMLRLISAFAGRVLAWLGLIFGIINAIAQADGLVSSATITNLASLARAASAETNLAYALHLEGAVWWANPAQQRLVLQDESGVRTIEAQLSGPFPTMGQRIRLTGISTVRQRGYALQLGPKGPVVDNNGVHGLIEKSGAVYLEAGPQPFRLEWFNALEKFGLELDYEGPHLPRQKIPNAALQHHDGTTTIPGLKFRCYDVSTEALPDFSQLDPIKSGVVSNFDLNFLPRAERIGAVFEGRLTVPQPGLYTFHLKSDDGSRLFVGEPTIHAIELGPTALPQPHRIAPGQIWETGEDGQWVEVEGKVTLVRATADGLQLEIVAGAGQMTLELGPIAGAPIGTWLNARIRAVGVGERVATTDGQIVAGVLLVPTAKEITVLETTPDATTIPMPPVSPDGLPWLTTAAEIHQLKREEAQRAYPVKIRGVVTCVLPEHQAFTLQDGTRGIYVVDSSPSRPDAPQPGEFLEIEGTSDPGLFAPMVNARVVRSLGAGRRPEAVRPTWDQLLNGSLDAQQVELQGIVTMVHSNALTLLLRGGVMKVELRWNGREPVNLSELDHALVRLRGTLFASWDYVTHQVQMGEIRLYGADVWVEQPAPDDLFSSPRKTASELLLFDPQASVFQRVKVVGQIVHGQEANYLLMDGPRGLRFTTKQPVMLAIGDTVEVVGFPDLIGSASLVVREAMVRKTGHAPLPPPRLLDLDNLISAEHDATRVRLEALLVGTRRAQNKVLLELQNGVRTFVAHLPQNDPNALALAPGSRLELTGVYVGLGGNRAAGQDITSFELQLTSPTDLRVLARPPWWTLKRLLVIVGVLACVLAAAALWITQLHRQVEERTVELGAQIRERQRVEHQRAMESERTRIAQDLHDELGSGITEMSMLAARAKSVTAPGFKREQYLEHVGAKARELVTALDEIVWAMNPRHDSLASLVSYFSLYADRFLGLANIGWKLAGPTEPGELTLDSRRRHQLFLAFKEALTNVVRHSGATEVNVTIQLDQHRLQMVVTDNGRGLPLGGHTEDMDGVNNMRRRIEKLGGRFEIISEPGQGVIVRFDVPSHYDP